MSTGSFVRKAGFYTLDLIRGGVCLKSLKDIQTKYADDRYTDEKDLVGILQYAIKNVPYYQNISDPILSQFPVMSKGIYKREGKNCFSVEYSDLDVLHKVQTGGSTGEPMVAYQDSGKRNRVKMDLIHAHECVGWHLGDKYVFIRNWASNYQQSRIKQIVQNFHPVPIATFDDEHKKNLVHYLYHNKRAVVFGYSSSVVDFMNYLIKNDIDASALNVKLIVCDSDELSNSNKKKLEDRFKCPVFNRYDNEENGLIAISDSRSNDLKVNYVSLHLELLDLNDDTPVAPGQVGRVVITDLYNKAMPLIRYDTGDLAVSLDEPDRIRILKELSGRKADGCFSVNGNLISNVALSVALEVFHRIEKYRLIQESRNTYKFFYEGILSKEEYKELQERLYELLGIEAVIEIKNVQLKNENNGKYKTIVNNWAEDLNVEYKVESMK